jgi:hypothetical protein
MLPWWQRQSRIAPLRHIFHGGKNRGFATFAVFNSYAWLEVCPCRHLYCFSICSDETPTVHQSPCLLSTKCEPEENCPFMSRSSLWNTRWSEKLVGWAQWYSQENGLLEMSLWLEFIC